MSANCWKPLATYSFLRFSTIGLLALCGICMIHIYLLHMSANCWVFSAQTHVAITQTIDQNNTLPFNSCDYNSTLHTATIRM